MIEQQSAGIITFYKKDKEILYLVLHYLSGHWDLPKGKLEAGETMEQAAHRELFEETQLKATLITGFQESLDYRFRERGKHIKKTVTFFVGLTDQQKVVLSREHQGYEWLPYEDACKKLTYVNAQDILTKAHTFLKNKQ